MLNIKRIVFGLLLLVFLVACDTYSEPIVEENTSLEQDLVDVVAPKELFIITYYYSNRTRQISAEPGVSLTLPTLYKEGYDFLGWSLNEDLKDPVKKLDKVNSDLNLYPVFEEHPFFRVTLIDETLNRIDELSIKRGNSTPLPVPESEGLMFDGWFLDKELTTPIDYVNDIQFDIRLYAKWASKVLPNQISNSYCKLFDEVNTNVVVGFPVPEERIPSIGSIKVKVLYLDFDDYIMNESMGSLVDIFEDYSREISKFYNEISYGKLVFEWDVHPTPLRMPGTAESYNLTREDADQYPFPTRAIVERMIDIHDSDIDFSDVELMVVMLNPDLPDTLSDFSPAHPTDINNPFITNERKIYNATTIEGDIGQYGFATIAHEIGHLLGLVDLYNYQVFSNNRGNGHHRHVGGQDIMGYHSGNNIQMLGWNRYLLGWIDDEQIGCFEPTQDVSEVLLENINNSGQEFSIVILPLSNHRAIVIEAREESDYCKTCNGILVYEVNTRVRNGNGPINIISPDRSVEDFLDDSMLMIGETVYLHNIQIIFSGNRNNLYAVSIKLID